MVWSPLVGVRIYHIRAAETLSPTRGCSRWVKGRGQKAGQGRCLKSKITNITFEDEKFANNNNNNNNRLLPALMDPKKILIRIANPVCGRGPKVQIQKRKHFFTLLFSITNITFRQKFDEFSFPPPNPLWSHMPAVGLGKNPWGPKFYIQCSFGWSIWKANKKSNMECTMRNRPPTGANKLYVANHPHSSSLSQIIF